MNTPGPWILDPCGDILARDRNTPTDNGLICSMSDDRNNAEGWANARLVCAAPDMASVIEDILCTFPRYNRDEHPEIAQAHDRARAVLAAVRGKPNRR